MATFVLVHPAWFGGWCWKKPTPLLHRRRSGWLSRVGACAGRFATKQMRSRCGSAIATAKGAADKPEHQSQHGLGFQQER